MTEPAFGMRALWIAPDDRELAEQLDYAVVTPGGATCTHLVQVIKQHAPEILTREETSRHLEFLRARSPTLVAKWEDGVADLRLLHRVLQNLLFEGVPIRDLETILETLDDWSRYSEDVALLTEYVRHGLRHTICQHHVLLDPAGGTRLLRVVALEPALEETLTQYIVREKDTTTYAIPANIADSLVTTLIGKFQRVGAELQGPVLLVCSPLRASLFRLIAPHVTGLAVLSYNEVDRDIQVDVVSRVGVARKAT